MRDRVPLNTARVPCRVYVPLGNAAYTLEFHYNAMKDFYVVHLFDKGNLVCAGEKVTYGRPLWQDCRCGGPYPSFRIVPMDEAATVDVANRDTVGRLVFLTIDDEGAADG